MSNRVPQNDAQIDATKRLEGRQPLITIHLPIDLGLACDVQAALAKFIPDDALWNDVVETSTDALTYYAPADLGE